MYVYMCVCEHLKVIFNVLFVIYPYIFFKDCKNKYIKVKGVDICTQIAGALETLYLLEKPQSFMLPTVLRSLAWD